jgi:hypothetical protein
LSDLSNDWQLSSASAQTLAALQEDIATNHNEPTKQASSSEATPPSLIPTDRLLFSFDDPVAYPSTAWSESLDPTASLSDETMHLVIPDFFGDLTEHDTDPPGAAQSGDNRAASHPASALLSMGSGGLLGDYMASLF